MIYLFGSFLSWRQVSFVCAAIPMLCILVAIFVRIQTSIISQTLENKCVPSLQIPETPIWLLSENRIDEAQKSLQVLRGWVSTESVSIEFEQLKRISEISASCANCIKTGSACSHPPPTLLDKFRDMTRKRTLKPFTLITILFFLIQFSAMFAMRPYIVQVLSAHGISLDANLTTTIIGVIGILANVFIVLFIRSMGKRRIYLYSMVGNFATCFGLCENHFVEIVNYWDFLMVFDWRKRKKIKKKKQIRLSTLRNFVDLIPLQWVKWISKIH